MAVTSFCSIRDVPWNVEDPSRVLQEEASRAKEIEPVGL